MKDHPGPLRTCLGCRTRKSQTRLRRLALIRRPEGPQVVWDEKRTRGGRGAWLCTGEVGCLEKGKKVLARAFRLKAEVDASALTFGGNRD